MDQFPQKFLCLHCGYDLRAAVHRHSGYQNLICPECGLPNRLDELHRYGIGVTTALQLGATIFAPVVILLVSAWLFRLWSGESVHALLSLMLAPVVITVHAYFMWTWVNERIILTKRHQQWIRWAAVICAMAVDTLGCIAVAFLFV